LTHQNESAGRSTIDATAKRSRANTKSSNEISKSNSKNAKKRLRYSVFVIRKSDDACAINVARRSKVPSDGRRTDSESRFWQQKYFLQKVGLRLIAAPQTPILVRIDRGRFARGIT
jgi:hypothetical protein